MSFLNFKENGTSESGKTKRWLLEPAGGGVKLGDIRWYGPWRKYVFQADNALFDEECLREIAEFIEKESRAHRKLLEVPATAQS